MALPGNVYRELLDIINKQLSLYEEYLKIQNDEREGLKKANVQKIKENTVLRSNILEYIYVLKNKLSTLITNEGENKVIKLLNKKASNEQKMIDALFNPAILPFIHKMYRYEEYHPYVRLTALLNKGGFVEIITKIFLKVMYLLCVK